MSTGVGNVNYLVAEKPLADAYWASKGGVGPGPGPGGATAVDYNLQFPTNAGVVAGTGWTYDTHYKCWRIAATPSADRDLAITVPGATWTNADVCRIRLEVLEVSVANAIELWWTGSTPAKIASIVAVGTYEQEYTVPEDGTGGVLSVRAKNGVAVVAAIKAVSVVKPYMARRIWAAANTGSCS
jgi:hypothetical protein